MSRSCAITLPFADGEYVFRIRFGEAVALQEQTDAGPRWIYGRLVEGSWHPKDISETIRQGLLGAKEVPVAKIKTLIEQYVEKRPALEHVGIAIAILEAHLIGVPDEPLKKSEGRPETPQTEVSQASPEEKSGSETSTDGEPQSGSPPEKSTSTLFGNSTT